FMQRSLIVYESRYGSTEEAAGMISLVLGPARSCKVRDFKDEYRDFDLFVIGSPVYGGAIEQSIASFARKNAGWLKDKDVALFCTCLDLDEGWKAVSDLKGLVGGRIIGSRVLKGRLKIAGLRNEDLQQMKAFSVLTGYPLQDRDDFDKGEVVDYALEIKRYKDGKGKKMPRDDLKPLVEKFLLSHNTCALATGHSNWIRSTPLEYSYQDGFIYIITEGGEKFAHILMNENVSLAVYNSYESMANLGGIQITGKASISGRGSQAYKTALSLKGVAEERIDALAIEMNVVQVRIEKAEFLNSEFKDLGYDIKQIL
ncbi:MAG TPA: flavodoxin domain-containing protein, partial [Methanotrichaceae archaeon]|nr:flavodoxin domain-containing protein [Methanotrichaceae archaeon]